MTASLTPAVNGTETLTTTSNAEPPVATLQLAIPGLRQEDLRLEVEQGVLIVQGKRPWHLPEGHRVLLQEFADTQIEKRYRLGENVDIAAISANIRHGILTITLPRRKDMGAHRIPIAVNNN
jgi:HSP20 family protein